MKAYLISDNKETMVGLKLAGIKGCALQEKSEIIVKLEEVSKEKDIGIIIVTEKIAALIPEKIRELKLAKIGPLIVEIPDRHGSIRGEDVILRYVRESIGLKM